MPAPLQLVQSYDISAKTPNVFGFFFRRGVSVSQRTCKPSAESNLFELCRGEAGFRGKLKERASRVQSFSLPSPSQPLAMKRVRGKEVRGLILIYNLDNLIVLLTFSVYVLEDIVACTSASLPVVCLSTIDSRI